MTPAATGKNASEAGAIVPFAAIFKTLGKFFELLLRVIMLKKKNCNAGSKPDLSYPYLSLLQLHYRTERQEFRKI